MKRKSGEFRIIDGYVPLADLARDLGLQSGSIHHIVDTLQLNSKYDVAPSVNGSGQRRQRLLSMEEVVKVYQALNRRIPEAWEQAYFKYEGPSTETRGVTEAIQAAFRAGGLEAIKSVCAKYNITDIHLTPAGFHVKRMVTAEIDIPFPPSKVELDVNQLPMRIRPIG